VDTYGNRLQRRDVRNFCPRRVARSGVAITYTAPATVAFTCDGHSESDVGRGYIANASATITVALAIRRHCRADDG